MTEDSHRGAHHRGLQFVALLHDGPLRRGQIDDGHAGDQLFVAELALRRSRWRPILEAFDDVFGCGSSGEEDHRNILRDGVGLGGA